MANGRIVGIPDEWIDGLQLSVSGRFCRIACKYCDLRAGRQHPRRRAPHRLLELRDDARFSELTGLTNPPKKYDGSDH